MYVAYTAKERAGRDIVTFLSLDLVGNTRANIDRDGSVQCVAPPPTKVGHSNSCRVPMLVEYVGLCIQMFLLYDCLGSMAAGSLHMQQMEYFIENHADE